MIVFEAVETINRVNDIISKLNDESFEPNQTFQEEIVYYLEDYINTLGKLKIVGGPNP